MIIGKIHEGSLDFDWGIRLIEKSNPVNMLGKIFETAILIYKHWAIMVYYEKLWDKIVLRKCAVNYTKKANIAFAL